ncbi:MAG TPA: phosphate butyryltransferase [Sedimentibacter sp.]|jgi:phosphate butyryltransferase|nr:phosphate butyryltransferase [Sedimentibacter sp.]HAS92618.1 phosphate butyryltransferase [Clostridiales bacterium]HOA20168.1 phosphate butyryltransferase [Sedimentibacter sp.]HOT21845.1 phosphate butyryltransferase [Sedimentibacter sp.]HPB78635.1 phosphate butyryltransferase [Sedimentibacter sp.]
MNRFDELLKMAKTTVPKKIAIAAAQDEDVLMAVKSAYLEKICIPILIGNKEKIIELSQKINFNLDDIQIIESKDDNEAARTAVSLVSSGKADILMKGLVDTAIILKAVLDKEIGLRTGNILSHAAVFESDRYHKLFIITDAAMNIAPSASEKKQIIENTLPLCRSLNIENPKVAVICAKEKVSPKMQATVDAEILVNMNKNGEIKGCMVEGPFGLDNAISREAAALKGVKGEVAGDADILLMPNIEAGNVMYKTLTYLADSKNAGIILGAKAPIILTSRADSDEAKLYSILLAVICSKKESI